MAQTAQFPATKEDFQLSSDLRLVCMRVARRVRAFSADEIPEYQYSVLVQLENGPRTLKSLAEGDCVSPPVMTRNINQLEALDLVAREADPSDKRQVLVHLTQTGEETLERVKHNRDQWMAIRMGKLDAEEIEVLRQATAIMQKMEILNKPVR